MTQGAMWVDLSCAQGDGTTEGERAGLARSRRWPLGGRRRVWLAGAIGACAAGLLTGCGSSPPVPQQTFADYTSTVTPTAPSPAPVPKAVAAPVRPDGMERTDEVGAAAAAMYFMTLNSYVLATGDVSEWHAVSGQDCDFCSNTAADVDAVYSKGHYYAGPAASMDEVRILGRDSELGIYSVELHYSLPAGVEVDGSGNVVGDLPAEDGYIVLEVVPSVRGWVLLSGVARDGASA